ncbi:MAG: GatB/YqeY domain-containing protein [Anaerolineales bacterium]|nr:GatB/YqeY domain-containing protein [Anaerolineales bacterium]
MSLKTQLTDDMKTAMRNGDTEKRNTLRMILAAIKQVEVDGRIVLDDDGVMNVLNKQAKQRRESIADYEKAGRAEMAAEEQAELAIIESYLPKLMSRDEIRTLASGIVAELGVSDAKGMGQVMGRLMPLVKDKADGRLVNEVVRELLQK